MKYPILTLRNAQKLISTDFTDDSSRSQLINELVESRGVGADAEDLIQNLEDDFLKCIDFNAGLKPSIDAVLRPIVHSHLCNLDIEVLSDRDFWRYLSAARFFDVVSLRHPKNQKSGSSDGLDSNAANFGALREDVRESFIFRLYLGAELSYDENNRKDPYHLARIHDVDLWQSHIVRVMTGDNVIYVRALLEWFRDRQNWYSRIKPNSQIGKLMSKYSDGLETRHLRDLVKRIRRLRSNIIHEYLDYPDIRNLLDSEATASLDVIAQWGREKVPSKSPRSSSKK